MEHTTSPASSGLGAIRIGVSVNFLHADPQRALFKGKTLQFVEEKMLLALRRAGAVPLLLPDLKDNEGAAAVVSQVEGVVLSGGADVSPESYGETLLDQRWAGDRIRDQYEIRVVEAAAALGRPLLGICRGAQLLNVAGGGTLYQDIATQVEGALVHRDWERYEIIEHDVRLAEDSWVAEVYGGIDRLLVNTVHHQAIKDLAGGYRATGWAPDGIIESIERRNSDCWMVGLQWHPEWLDGSPEGGSHRPRGDAILRAFVDVCRERCPDNRR